MNLAGSTNLRIRSALLAAFAACMLALGSAAPAFADNGGGGGHSGSGGGGGNSGSGSSGSGASGPGSSGSGSSGSGSSGSGKDGGSMSSSDQAQVRKAVSDGDARTLSDIIPALRRTAPGKILGISFGQGGGGFVYTFQVLTDAGRIVDVSMDAKTGATLAVRGR